MDFNYSGGAKVNILDVIQKFGVPNTFIEVGVFEGGTTFWFSDEFSKFNENLKIYAIDPHIGSNDMSEDPIDVHANFVHNLEEHEAKNVNYIRSHSEHGLMDLIVDGVKAEMIYIDGDHRAPEVLTDLVLAYKLLVPGGVIICDDCVDWQFKDENGNTPLQMSPRLAVENFIQCYWDRIKPLALPNSGQTAFIKIK